jgi:flotillin
MSLVIFLIGLILSIAPILLSVAYRIPIPIGITIAFAIVGVLLIVVAAVMGAINNYYVKPEPNQVLVRTGQGGIKVIKDDGGWVIPVLHKTKPVSLENGIISIVRDGRDESSESLRTKDNLRALVVADFIYHVDPTDENIIAAVRAFGDSASSPDEVAIKLRDRFDSALRSAAADFELDKMVRDRKSYRDIVFRISEETIHADGLRLIDMPLKRVDQAPKEQYDPNNILDAQGLKTITLMVTQAEVERNNAERNKEKLITEKNVQTRQQVLSLEQAQKQAEVEQATQVAKYTSEKNREQNEFKIIQEQAVAQRNISKDLALRQAEIEKERALVQSEQQKATTEVERVKAIETANREKEIAIAAKQAELAAAEAKRQMAEAQREKASQEVVTVQKVSEAERNARTTLIGKQNMIEQKRLEEQMEADVAAYSRIKEAEAAQLSAEKQAQANVKLAEADQQASILRAEGDQRARVLTAQGMEAEARVPVNVKAAEVDVERKRVDVRAAEVEVERQALENKQQFSEAALNFELKKLEIEKSTEYRIALANAMGIMLSSTKMTVFGDPLTAQAMMASFMRAAEVSVTTDGFMSQYNPAATDEALKIVTSSGDALRNALSGILGQNVNISNEKLAQIITSMIQKNGMPASIDTK